MPFVETYSVAFSNGNLHPYLDLNGWSDMQLFPPIADEFADRFPDSSGYTFQITRNLKVPAEVPARNNVYVVPPPGSLRLDTRLFMRVTFDLPRAEGFFLFDHDPLSGEFEPLRRTSSAERGRLAGELEAPGSVTAGPALLLSKFSIPEPWAVALNVSPTSDLLSESMVTVTCQFNRRFDGVRLNTPNIQDIGSLQTDKAACLESPLNYGNYQGGYVAFPNGTDGVVDPPVFCLEHSFCGWDVVDNEHTPGSGTLKVFRSWQTEVQDHRVFSSNALISSPGQQTSIGALGISLVTLSGFGRMSVRLRTFSIWINESV